MDATKSIGPYKVASEIGRGGMGVVYLANDSRLDRPVAIKALPEHLTEDPDRLARFDREARTLASLNHPNIAGVHAVEEADSTKFLILEYVEGPTLADLLENGPLQLDDALEICIQVAAGVEAAHDAGIIHRDLKPANIKITPDHKVKVLDFGLAKATDASPGSSIASSFATLPTTPHTPHSPTIPGAILGTAPYMSPEQARGKSVDKRTDVWSFAVILYECLTGLGPFKGETITDSIGAILHKDVNLDLLPPGTPARVRRLLERCLERDKNRRLRDIGDARLELEEALRNPGEAVSAPPAPAAARRSPLVLVVVALLGIAIGALATRVGPLATARPTPPIVYSEIPAPEGSSFHLAGVNPGPVALSPDGSRMVFSAPLADSGQVVLWLRNLDEPDARAMQGTNDAQYPFWSPDGRHVAFFADGKLKRIPAEGGAVLALADAPNGKGGSWSTDGQIIFAPSSTGGLALVADSGGVVQPLTTLNEQRGQNSHRHPRFLPDAKRFLYLARIGSAETTSQGHDVMLSSIESPYEATRLTQSVTNVEYASGHLLYMIGDVLLAQPFDARAGELRGDPRPLCDQVSNIPGAVAGVFSASHNGVLAYQRGTGVLTPSQLVWYDREGNRLGVMGEPAPFMSCCISPDGTLVASVIIDPQRGTGDVWIDDLARDVRSRLTFEPTHEGWPTFSPDSTRVCYFTDRSGATICEAPVAGFEAERILLEAEHSAFPTHWTPDGEFLAFSRWDAPGDAVGMYLLPAAGGQPQRIAAAPGI